MLNEVLKKRPIRGAMMTRSKGIFPSRKTLFKAFERAQQKGVFKNIPNAVEWQKNLRNDPQ